MPVTNLHRHVLPTPNDFPDRGTATLAYQVDHTKGVVTVSPQDLTTAAGLAALTNGLQGGAKVTVSAVPQSDGTLKAYVITYYTGTAPSN